MQQRPLGRSGLAVSRLALGTMTWGRDTDPDDAAAQLKYYLEAGGTLIDTADVYGDGDAESVIGSLLDQLVPRDDVLIATKAGLTPGGWRRRDGSRGHLLRSLDASLRRLGTDYVDLWQVHGYDPQTPLEETLAALDHAVASGRVRYVGRVELRRLADRAGRGVAGRVARAGPRSSPPRWSIRCSNAGSSGSCCRPPRPWASACCRGRRWAAGC